jgi:septum formation protein
MAEALILASRSPSRATVLKGAGLAFTVEVAAVDEAAVKESLLAEGADAGRAAETLAELKAGRISARRPEALVIGADQILDADGRWFDKPRDAVEARAQLLALAGRAHRLVSAVVVVRGGVRLWHCLERARMTMRALDAAAIERYLATVGASAMASPGAYQIEGPGIQLFDAVEGDHFGILGLPLLPLLAFLRARGHGLP